MRSRLSHAALVRGSQDLDRLCHTVLSLLTGVSCADILPLGMCIGAVRVPDGVVCTQVRLLPSFSSELKGALLAAATAVLYTPADEHFGIVPLEVPPFAILVERHFPA